MVRQWPLKPSSGGSNPSSPTNNLSAMKPQENAPHTPGTADRTNAPGILKRTGDALTSARRWARAAALVVLTFGGQSDFGPDAPVKGKTLSEMSPDEQKAYLAWMEEKNEVTTRICRIMDALG